MERKIILLAIFLCSVITACGQLDDIQDEENVRGKITLTKSQMEVMDKTNSFSWDLFREFLKVNANENMIISPLSVSATCMMLANGATGNTYDEIVDALGLEGYTLDQVNEFYTALTKGLDGVDKSVSMNIANSLWVSSDFDISKDYKNNIVNWFGADVYSVEFAKSKTLQQINTWCSDKTQGLVPKMFDELNPELNMMLISALFYKAAWSVPFSTQKKTGEFISIDGSSTTCSFMWKEDSAAKGYSDEDVSVCIMPYGNGAYNLVIIMPKHDFVASALEYGEKDAYNRLKERTSARVEIDFPKFECAFDTKNSMTAALKNLGIKSIFSPADSEFSPMKSGGVLNVDIIQQKSAVAFDENGTTAAAVTAATLRGAAPGQQEYLKLSFNRPFFYVIEESSTNAILFIGAKVK